MVVSKHYTETIQQLVASRMTKWFLLPLFGCILFVVLYIIAALYYPGGSPVDKYAKGFRWSENYWCNLLNEEALNGKHNAARPFAFAAMITLSLTLITFWYLFPLQVGFKRMGKLAVQVSGLLAMATGFFLFTRFHDLIIDVASVFGLIALGGTFAGLKKLQWHRLFWAGLFMLVLIALNNLCYYNNALLSYLAVVQKISFLYFLIWISLISIALYNKAKFQRLISA